MQKKCGGLPTRRYDAALKAPTLAVFVVQKSVCLGRIGDLQIRAVPDQFFTAILDAHAAEQDRFGERAGEIETRARGRARLASLDPFLVMTNRARQRLRRALVFLIARFRD